MGGVADYAVELARFCPTAEWIVAQGSIATSEMFPDWTVTDAASKGWAAALDRQSECTMLVHYTQYGFSSVGIPWAVVRALEAWRRGGKRRRLVVFFHETWLQGPPWKRRGLVSPAARWCARSLACAADVIVTNCPRHAAQLAIERDVAVLPVPANIEPEDGGWVAEGGGRRTEGPLRVVVFGLPETRLRTLRAHRGFLTWLNSRGELKELMLLGAGAEMERFSIAGARLAAELTGGAVRRVGASEAAGVSSELARADLGLSAYAADEVGKSGTLAALFTHGCPVGCAGHDAGGLALDLNPGMDGTPRDWAAWLDSSARARREARVATYVADSLDWPAHAMRLAGLVAGRGTEVGLPRDGGRRPE